MKKISFGKQLNKIGKGDTEQDILSKLHKASIKRQISLKMKLNKNK